jgi:hypothetical protein
VKKHFLGLCAGVLACCALPAAHAADPGYASLDNVAYGMLGSWFDPATSGQGFDVQFYADTDHSNAAIVYWYTFDTAAKQKVWFLALGPIAGNTAHLQIAEPSLYQGFDQPAPPASHNEAVGTAEFELVDCAHAHIAWHFDRTLTNGLGAANDGAADLRRLTPAISVLGKYLCSTPLSAFGISGSAGGDQLGQCIANYNGLLTQFQGLNSNYSRCIDKVAGDETTIDILESEVSSLQADVDAAYDDGYGAGNSAGYDEGYGDGYSDGYDEGSGNSSGYDGYDAGYGDGYSAGYDEGTSSCAGDSVVAASKLLSGSPQDSAHVQSATSTTRRNPTHSARDEHAARAQRTIRRILEQLDALKQQRGKQD